jgi:hypothetical protein
MPNNLNDESPQGRPKRLFSELDVKYLLDDLPGSCETRKRNAERVSGIWNDIRANQDPIVDAVRKEPEDLTRDEMCALQAAAALLIRELRLEATEREMG